MSHICQYCKKTFLNKHNLDKHISHPSQKCLEFRHSLKKPENYISSINVNITKEHRSSAEDKQEILELKKQHLIELQNKEIHLQIKEKEINELKNLNFILENKIKEYETKCFDYETIVDDYKSLVNDYQKDYFDCLDKYISAFKENYDLKKSLQKSSDFNQMIEQRHINLSKSN